jgi:GNAT superfamily N-acetyltransferase
MEEEMNQDIVQAKFTTKDQISPDEISELIQFFKIGYGERWVSDEHFRDVVMSNMSDLLRLYSEDKLVAAAGINVNRITDISVDPNQRGKGLGLKLFEEAAKNNPRLWITVGVDAPEMLATVASPELNLLPIKDPTEIEKLFKEINGITGDFQIETTEVELPLLTERLQKKGINQDKFLAFSRTNSLHGNTYKQILFQNQT